MGPKMQRRLSIVICAVLVSALGASFGTAGAWEQGQAASTTLLTIAGRVIDGDNNEPLQDAEVRLGPPPRSLPPGVRPQDLPRQSPPSTTLTDQNGQFSLSNVKAGSYTLGVYKAGYIPGSTRPLNGDLHFDVFPGENVTNVTLRMWRQSVIAGTVRTSSGRPVTGTTVIAVRVSDTREGPWLQRSGVGLQGRLDDRGEYRIANLVPGRYLLCVRSPQAEAAWRVGREHSMDIVPGECEEFYPNATLPTEAVAITLGTGEEHAADIEVPDAIDSVPVSGHVEGLPQIYGKTQVRLVLPNGSADVPAGFQVGAVDLGADGSFAFPAVRPGTYLIRGLAIPPTDTSTSPYLEMLQPASGGSLGALSRPDTRTAIRPLPPERARWFEQRLDVEHQPVRDLILHALPGATVSGRVILDAQLVLSGSELEAIPIFARPYGEGGWNLDGLPMGRIEADGSFRSAALPPDRYSVQPYAEGDWYSESEVVGGRDVQGEGVDLRGDDLANVVVTLTRQRAVVSGVVHDSAGKPRPDASVFVFPAEERNWTFGEMNVSRPNGHGEYTQPFSAGAWILVAAVSDRPVSGFLLDSDFLRTLVPHGTTVTLTRGEHKTVNLSLQEIGKH